MPNPTNPANPNQSKHLRSFWPLVIILVIAVIFCGLILYAANSSMTQDDIDSTNLGPMNFIQRITPHSTSKTPAKKSTTK